MHGFVVSYQTLQQNDAVCPGPEEKQCDRQVPKIQLFKTTSLFQTIFLHFHTNPQLRWTHQLTNWSSLHTELNLTDHYFTWRNTSGQNLDTFSNGLQLTRKGTLFDCSSLRNCTRYCDPRPTSSEDKQPKRQRHWQLGSTLQRLRVLC